MSKNFLKDFKNINGILIQEVEQVSNFNLLYYNLTCLKDSSKHFSMNDKKITQSQNQKVIEEIKKLF